MHFGSKYCLTDMIDHEDDSLPRFDVEKQFFHHGLHYLRTANQQMAEALFKQIDGFRRCKSHETRLLWETFSYVAHNFRERINFSLVKTTKPIFALRVLISTYANSLSYPWNIYRNICTLVAFHKKNLALLLGDK